LSSIFVTLNNTILKLVVPDLSELRFYSLDMIKTTNFNYIQPTLQEIMQDGKQQPLEAIMWPPTLS